MNDLLRSHLGMVRWFKLNGCLCGLHTEVFIKLAQVI